MKQIALLFMLLLLGACASPNMTQNKAFDFYQRGLAHFNNHQYQLAQVEFNRALSYVNEDKPIRTDEHESYFDIRCNRTCEVTYHIEGDVVDYRPNYFLKQIAELQHDLQRYPDAEKYAMVEVVLAVSEHSRDQILQAGEHASLMVRVINIGEKDALDLSVQLSSNSDEFITFADDVLSIGSLSAGEIWQQTISFASTRDALDRMVVIDALVDSTHQDLVGDTRKAQFKLDSQSLRLPQYRLAQQNKLGPIQQSFSNTVEYLLCNDAQTPRFGVQLGVLGEGIKHATANVFPDHFGLIPAQSCELIELTFTPSVGLQVGEPVAASITIKERGVDEHLFSQPNIKLYGLNIEASATAEVKYSY